MKYYIHETQYKKDSGTSGKDIYSFVQNYSKISHILNVMNFCLGLWRFVGFKSIPWLEDNITAIKTRLHFEEHDWDVLNK